MAIKVEVHPDSRAFFFDNLDPALGPILDNLLADFAKYKESNGDDYPDYFGKDVPYMNPKCAYDVGLMHIHLLPPGRTFPRDLPQNKRVCPLGEPEADIQLVYVAGFYDVNSYCILGLLHPDAHGQARSPERMRYFSEIAFDWQNKN